MKRTALLLLLGLLLPLSAAAEEFYLKDSTKLVGKIVGFEENAFRVETSFGIAIIYKDRIERIVFPAAPHEEAKPSPEKSPEASSEPPQPAADTAPARAEEPPTETAAAAEEKTKASEDVSQPAPAPAAGEPDPTESSEPVRTAAAQPPLPLGPREIIEHIQGTDYWNETYGFRLFKPLTWRSFPQLVNPNTPTVAALGTADETTLLLIGREAYAGTLADYARLAEGSLQRIYRDYRPQGERPTSVGGLPAIERHFIGEAEERYWTGVAVYFARGREYFTVLALTAAGEQTPFQQAVLRKVLGSLEFVGR